MIYRTIHQTWKADDNIPDEVYLPEWRKSWQDEHPDWEYRFWTDEDNDRLVRDCYPQFFETYNKFKRGVVRSDVARVLYLHREGGMYVDLDFVCLRSFDALLNELGEFIVVGTHNQPRQPIPNAWMYSPPGEVFWLRYVEDALRDWESGQREVEKIAGPDRLNWALERYKPQHVALPHKMVYPFAWGNTEKAVEAGRMDWSNLDSLRERYPGSLAVTAWTHNW